jgi:hypothetical protein
LPENPHISSESVRADLTGLLHQFKLGKTGLERTTSDGLQITVASSILQ